MQITLFSSVITTSLLIITLITGHGLSSLGRPLNTWIFTVHKLLSLGTAVYIVMMVRRIYKYGGGFPAEALPAVLTAGAGLLLTMATGILLGLPKPVLGVVPVIHRFSPYLTSIATIVSFIIILKKK